MRFMGVGDMVDRIDIGDGVGAVDGRCPTCRQRKSRVREHERADGSRVVWHCNVAGCSNKPISAAERADDGAVGETGKVGV